MSKRDPIEDYFASLSAPQEGAAMPASADNSARGGDPIDQYFLDSHPGAYQEPVHEGIGERIWHGTERLNNWIGEAVKSTASLVATSVERGVMSEGVLGAYQSPGILSPTIRARGEATAAGIASGAILEPAQGILGIPGMLQRTFGGEVQQTDKAVNFFARAQGQIYTEVERNAKHAGLSDEQIHGAYETGNFIGIMLPLEASIKLASIALRAPAAAGLLTHAFTGNLVTDVVAGAIYGGAFKPGDTWQDRGMNLSRESAMFGVGRIILGGIGMPFRAYRLNRLRGMDAELSLHETIHSMENASGPVQLLAPQHAERIMGLLSEEGYISSSNAAQDIITRVQDEHVLVKAITDVAGTRGTGGRVRGFQKTFVEMTPLVDSFREQFPNLKFDVLKNPDGGYDVLFGTKGLNNKQRAQLSREGMFDGQKVYREGSEYTYRGPASREDYHRLETADGKIIEVKKSNVTDLPFHQDTFDATPQTDALFTDFRRSYEERASQMSGMTGAIPEERIIEAVRRGVIKLDDNARRAFDVGGAIIYPEELGLASGPEAIAGVRFAAAPDGMAAKAGASGASIQRMEDGSFELVHMNENSVPVGRAPFATIEEAAQMAQQLGYQPTQVFHQVAQAGEVAQSILREGTTFANVMEPPPVMTFEEIFDRWAEERGFTITNERKAELSDKVRDLTEDILVRERASAGQDPAMSKLITEKNAAIQELATARPKDYEAMRDHFARRIRDDMWAMVPDDERQIFNAIRDELETNLIAAGDGLSRVAHDKGFFAEHMADGTIDLREINTGMRFNAPDEETARAALRAVVRQEEDFMGGFQPLESMGISPVTGGGAATDGLWDFTGAMSKEFIENIPESILRNNRDWLQSVENMTGVPLFTKGFNEVDLGINRMRIRYEPWAKQIQAAWKGLSRSDKEVVANFWRDIEGTDLTLAESITLAKEQGLTGRQLGAWVKSRAIFDEGYRMAGLPSGRYIHNYYARVRPWIEENNGAVDMDRIFGDGNVPAEFTFFGEMARTGDLAMVEMDPEIVMHKWFRALFFKQEVKESWDRLAQLVDRGGPNLAQRGALKVKDLPQAQIDRILELNPAVSLSDPVLAKPIRDVISEYLVITRGQPGESLSTLRKWNVKLFNYLGIKGDAQVLEDWLNMGMSNMYGAAMAGRASVVARNQTQTIWNQYTRLGARWGGKGLEAANTVAGFREAMDAGAIRMAEAGVPYGDAIFRHMTEAGRVQGTGPFSNAMAGAIRLSLRLGHVSQKFAETLLVPFSSGEQMSRAWSYHWQKLHTGEALNLFEARRIGWDKFLEDGMPMFAAPIKREFEDLYREQGKEAALRFIGKMAADETHFIYGVGASPAWMQKPMGRIFGMFGTWPLWAVELYMRRTLSGTMKQQAAFWGRTLALTGAFANMSLQSGVNMWSWIQPAGMLGWTGGPMVDTAINAKRVIDAPMGQKGQALKRMGQGIGKLSLPGQMFFHDFVDAVAIGDQTGNPTDAFMRLMMGRHVKEGNYSMKFLYTGDEDPGTLIFQNRESENALVDPYMRVHKLDQPSDIDRFPLLEDIIGAGGGKAQHSIGARVPRGSRGQGQNQDIGNRTSGSVQGSRPPNGLLQGNMP